MDSNIVASNLNIITGSYETFTVLTRYPNVFCIDLTTGSTKTNFINTLASSTNTTYTQVLSTFDLISQQYNQRVANNISIADFATSTSTTLYTPIFQAGGYIDKFVSNFVGNPLPSISSYNNIDATQLQYKTIIYSTFYDTYATLVTAFTTGQLSVDFNSPIAPSLLHNSILALTNIIETNAYSYMINGAGTLDSYLTAIYSKVMASQAAVPTLKTSHLNLYFICFLPYFYFLYIYNVLPSALVSGTNHGIRDGMVRRAAILSMYKFFTYVIYGTYKIAVLVDPSSAQSMELRQILDTNITALFDSETNSILTSGILSQLDQDTKTNIKKMSSLQNQNQKITMNRANMTNILTYQSQANADYSKAVKAKWIWLVFFLIYVATIPVFYFLWQKVGKFVEYYFIASLVIVLVLVILAMISVAKKMVN